MRFIKVKTYKNKLGELKIIALMKAPSDGYSQLLQRQNELRLTCLSFIFSGFVFFGMAEALKFRFLVSSSIASNNRDYLRTV